MVLTMSLAKEVAQYGIRISDVAPHATDASDRVTPRTYAIQIPPTDLPEEERASAAAFRRELVAREIALGKRWRAEDRAAAIAFLASAHASFITGWILPVGGGAMYPFSQGLNICRRGCATCGIGMRAGQPTVAKLRWKASALERSFIRLGTSSPPLMGGIAGALCPLRPCYV
jgi:enoyl-ACP reductase-like protein